MCVTFQPILRLFLVTSGAVRSRVRLLVAQKHAHKARAPRTTYRIDYPAPLDYSIATARIAPLPAAFHREQKCAPNVRLFLIVISTAACE